MKSATKLSPGRASIARVHDPGKMMSPALSRTPKLSTLRANQAFIELQAQLEGTENRITVARHRYIQAVQDYNVTVHTFPSNLTAMAFGYKERPSFSVDNEQVIAKPPVVNFPHTVNPAPTPGSGVTK